MFSLHQRSVRLCDGVDRRQWLRIGGLGALGLSLPGLSLPALLQRDAQASEAALRGGPPTDKSFGRAKNVIFLYLLGGPPQHETFDPKPEAPAEIRGEFRPIATKVPGIQFCELLPRTARLAHKLAVVRSITTGDNSHDGSGYALLTGNKYVGPNSRTIQPSDWPTIGSLVKMLKPSEKLPPLSSVWLPDVWRLNENVTPAGQTAGFLGARWNPEVFVGDPARPDYQVQGLKLTDMPPLRLNDRRSLLGQVQSHFDDLRRGERALVYDQFQQQAFELMTSDRARRAFDLGQETPSMRERYGRYTWGQSLLLARRLVEAGVRMVHVNWPREPGDNAVDNPLWDTHAQNADRLEDVLCPQFDVSFSALIEDLDERGLLEETLVVAIGEFGRTPNINRNGGRDHWGACFSFALAGAGIQTGLAYGASDARGAYPARNAVQPGDFTATLFHLLGIDYRGMFHDPQGRPLPLTTGQPLFAILGADATSPRLQPAGGDVARVPPFDRSLLLNVDFSAPQPLLPLSPSRPKGWRGYPELALANDAASADQLGVRLVPEGTWGSTATADDSGESVGVKREALLGIRLGRGTEPVVVPEGAQAFLAQEVRSPFAGHYVLRLSAAGDGDPELLAELRRHFVCRMIFFQYLQSSKNPLERKELASRTIEIAALADSSAPGEAEANAGDPNDRKAKLGGPPYPTFELAKTFENPTPGGNFSFGLGLGVAVVLERITAGAWELSAAQEPQRAALRIARFELEFQGKERKEDVVV